MKIEYTKSSSLSFKDLEIGELFTTADQGLFLKVGKSRAMVVVPLNDEHPVNAAQTTGWEDSYPVIRVRRLIVETD